ncbi:hypothetical protein MSAN_01108500 [Mycena sanguinolenta]|uniref:Ubiquitin-like domain-containing protein n=1 Tax=Mycena sanguinolenta TaxID=230812 RepID=A0A8H6YTD8_9AGAR|nr:hypothetical protein MSAN_01108500 [Mycena sanguinolenta]
MVKIYVAHHTNEDYVWNEYDVDLADSVRKLKSDIYATEGAPVGRQCLQYEGTELRDEQDLQSYSLQDGFIIDRSQNGIVVELPGWTIRHEVDLDGRLSDLKGTFLRWCSALEYTPPRNIKFKEQVLEWDDRRTFSVLGMHNDDSVTVLTKRTRIEPKFEGVKERQVPTSCGKGAKGGHSGEIVVQGGIGEGLMARITRFFRGRSHHHGDGRSDSGDKGSATPPKTQEVLYDWDGAMKHPDVSGLPLRKGMRVIEAICYDDTNESLWCFGREQGMTADGYFPRNYIRDENTAENAPTPRLPEFDFPLASPAVFILRLGENGLSYVQATLSYHTRAPPDEPTLVDVSLVCTATGGRRIASVGLMIKSPGQRVRDVKYQELTQPQQTISVKTTQDKTVENTLGAALSIPQAGLSGNAGTSRGHKHTVHESGTRESQLRISGNPYGEQQDIAHWSIDAAEGVGGRFEGIPAQMNLSFVLDEKPAIFQHRYFVVSTDARANRRTHSGGSLEDPWEKPKVLEWWGRFT